MAARPRCSVLLATSLDGLVARADGSTDRLRGAQHTAPASEDCGYAAIGTGIAALVMVRASVEQALTLDPWPYGLLPADRWLRHTAPLSLDFGFVQKTWEPV